MSINRVTISGNLTRDPEVRTTQSGMPVMSLGIAVNDRHKNSQTGEWEDHANFVDCTMFGTRAQNVSQYLAKGSKVCIDGKLRWSQWERDGQKRSKIEVIINDIDLCGSNGPSATKSNQPNNYTNNGANGGYTQSQQAYSAPSRQPFPIYDDASVYDESIPF